MPETLTDRVRQIITDSRLTQTQFAEEIGIDGPKLSKSLKGQRRFTSYELAAIAERAHETVDWLLTGTSRTRVFAHRAIGDAVAAGDEVGRRRIDLIDDRFEGLAFLGRTQTVPDLPKAIRKGRYIDQGAETAALYVERIDAQLNKLSTPALIDQIEAAFGVNIVVADLPEGCDGLSYVRNDLRVIVLATSSTAPYRQRFTLAHELGHIAFGDAFQEVIEEQMRTASGTLEETRSNTFAAHFLAPGDDIREVIGDRDVSDAFSDLVLGFQVSPDSMAWRLFNEGLIDASRRSVLAVESARAIAMRAGRAAQYAEQAETASQERPPLRLVGEYLSAYADGQATLRPAASLLGWTIEQTEATFGPLDDVALNAVDY